MSPDTTTDTSPAAAGADGSTVGQDTGADASREFTLLIGLLESGEPVVLMSYQDVRWHFTPDQAEALGHALVDGGQRAREMTAAGQPAVTAAARVDG